MKVLIFSLSYLPLVGGAEIAVKEITNRISPADAEFEMVTMRFDKSHPRFERVGNVGVHRIGGGFGYLSKVLFVFQAALFSLKKNYDLHWALMTYMLFPAAIARILGSRTPYVLTLQDGDPFERVFGRARIALFMPLLTYGFRHAKRVQAISNFLAEWAMGMGYSGKVEIIPNGVDFKKFENLQPKIFLKSEIRLITTSRLVEKNGVADIIKALPYLSENISLEIIGTGELEEKLHSLAEKLNLKSRINFKGFVHPDEISAYLHKADIFVRPSLSEGFGNSFIEAMAAGLPVIATPVGGITDFVKDGETGLFSKPGDPKNLSETIKRLVEDISLMKKLSVAGRNIARERYDWDLIAQEMKTRFFANVSL